MWSKGFYNGSDINDGATAAFAQNKSHLNMPRYFTYIHKMIKICYANFAFCKIKDRKVVIFQRSSGDVESLIRNYEYTFLTLDGAYDVIIKNDTS